MAKFLKGLTGAPSKSAKAKSAAAQAEQQLNISRQLQDAQNASGATDAQLNRAKRTPRGRRALIGDGRSTLG